MRTILFSLLLASVASAPALAEGPRDRHYDPQQPATSDSSDGGRRDAPRSDHGDRGDRGDRPSFGGGDRSGPRDQPRFERAERPSFGGNFEPRVQDREQPAPRTMTGDPGWARRGPDDSALHAGRDPRAGFERGGATETIDQVQQRFERRQRAIRDTAGQDINRQWVDQSDGRRGGPRVSTVPRQDTQPPLRADGRRPSVQWDRSWRDSRRYDWQDHRRRHRTLFHLGFYYDPFGWNYRPYQIGWRMWPDYYSSRYWINDPWQYRLPYAPPGTRWIRYWDDALLVDTWSGQVVDRIPNFFW